MTELEKTMVWMSYRYCIGRHTIAAHCHAGDLANFIYDKTSDSLAEFINKMLQLPEESYILMCNNSLNRAKNMFSAEKYVKELEKYYNALL